MDSVYIEGMYKTNTDLVTKAVADIPADEWLRKPGDGSNHLLWVMGHLVWARGNVVKTLGSPWSLDWAKQFSRGAAGVDAADYPAVEEVSKAWADVSAELPKFLAAASPELLDKPHDKPTFDGKMGGFIAFLAFHETYHVGQVGYLRKWLGHSQLVG
jgi:uncharacterized damage-inducible protein DinB